MDNPKVSIITVVYNAADLLEITLQNVRSQTYPNIEYIIIDGGSNDGSKEVIEKYAELVDYWISEPDKGIYDAMNKGLKAATGDYVWFINAGDLIFDPDTTAKIFETEENRADIYYGDTMIVNDAYEEIGLRRLRPPQKLNWKSFRKGMLVCHQAILVSRKIVDLYNLNYPHSADFDWVIKALKKTSRIKNTHQILARFLDGGQSKKTIKPSLAERFSSMKTHYGFFPSLLSHIPIGIRFFTYLFKYKRF